MRTHLYLSAPTCATDITPLRNDWDDWEEAFTAGWSTASSDAEESECEDGDSDVVYLGSKPAPSTESSIIPGPSGEDEPDDLEFGARFLCATPSEVPDAHAPSTPAKPALEPSRLLR